MLLATWTIWRDHDSDVMVRTSSILHTHNIFQMGKVRPKVPHTHSIQSLFFVRSFSAESHRIATEVPFSSYFDFFADYAMTNGSAGWMNIEHGIVVHNGDSSALLR